jgi:hypothetical protein
VSGRRPNLAAGGLATLAGLAAGTAQAQGPVIEHRVAVLQGLDKVTARISPVRAPLETPTTFGTLEIVARTCRETPPTEPPESAAFLEIRELPPASDPDGPRTELFSGWMFASSPAVSALEHPVYDVWVVDCEEPIERAPDAIPELPTDDQGATDGTPPASP